MLNAIYQLIYQTNPLKKNFNLSHLMNTKVHIMGGIIYSFNNCYRKIKKKDYLFYDFQFH